VVAQPEQLLKGTMGGAALDAVDSPVWFEAWVRDISNLMMTPRCACYSDQAFAELVAAEPLSTLGSGGEDAAPSGTAKTEGAEGHYYGLRMDAARKVCRLAAMPGLSKADPAVQLIVIRRKNTVGFRAGLAEGKVLQLTKAREMLFANHNFGSWESWHMAMDGDVFVLSNKKWKEFKWKVKIEVVGEVVNGVVRLKGT